MSPITPFSPRPVPIVGQPFSVKGWSTTVLVSCHCGAHEIVLLVGQIGTTGGCPACGRIFRLSALAFDPQTQQMQFQIAMGTPDLSGAPGGGVQ